MTVDFPVPFIPAKTVSGAKSRFSDLKHLKLASLIELIIEALLELHDGLSQIACERHLGYRFLLKESEHSLHLIGG